MLTASIQKTTEYQSRLSYLLLLLLVLSACQAQTESNVDRIVGGGCEGCEAVFEYGSKSLSNVDTLPLFTSSSPKLKLFGKVYQKDGRTPAEGVILYIYHTNRDGLYQRNDDEKGWGRRHGFIRGWVKTDKDGSYTFYTFRPAAYPGGAEPEHIHIFIKEPNINEYYIDDFVFDDDPLLTPKKRKSLPERAGSGIVNPVPDEQGILQVRRDIVLGLNIPDYD